MAGSHPDQQGAGERAQSFPPLPDPNCSWALFLDVDGTLLDIAATPEAVVVTEALRDMLAGLCHNLEGAIALLSGRSLQDLDRLFAPLRLPAAGQHGAEWRLTAGAASKAAVAVENIEVMRREAAALAARLPGVLCEDKGLAVALHWRHAPDAEAELRAGAMALAERSGMVVQPGKRVFELKPPGVDKGVALRRLLEHAPFAGRRPLFIGDDLTDAFAIEAAQAAGGMAIAVGDTLAEIADTTLADPPAVKVWLQQWRDRLAARNN